MPADALVYLESNDLGKTLTAITGNPRFQQIAKTKPDLSSLDGVKISIAVTGFEASEQPVTQENSVIDWHPRIVAAVETNAWGWQTKSFVEDQLGEFVNEVYDGAIELEITTRKDGEFYVWTSEGGRKAYALQQGSLFFFGNDESAIERCQAVKRGEAESIAKSGKIPEGESLAFGYVSPEGVGQIANLVGMQLAKSTGEEADVQSFVARVLPEILRNSVKELTWSATKTEPTIEDKYVVTLDDESVRVFNETIVPAKANGAGLESFVPAEMSSATRYLLRDPQIAWRSIVLTAQKKTDETSGALIAAFSGSVFESYGIEEPEMFLSSIGDQLITVRVGQDSDDVAVIATVKDRANIRKSIAKEIRMSAAPVQQSGAEVWKSEDGELAAAFVGDTIIVGEVEVVSKCLVAKQSGTAAGIANQLSQSDAVTVTAGSGDATAKLVEIFSEPKDVNERMLLQYKTETRFNKNGIERRTTSDFGLIGAIIERLVPE